MASKRLARFLFFVNSFNPTLAVVAVEKVPGEFSVMYDIFLSFALFVFDRVRSVLIAYGLVRQ